MGRPKNSAYLTDAELTWFDLEHYDQLGNSQTPPLPAKEFIKLWTHVIYDRLQLQMHSCSEDPEVVAKVQQLFGILQRTPLAELNFGQNIPKHHPCDTSTVKLLSVNRAHSLSMAFSDIAISKNDEGLQAVDELLLNRESPERFFVHLSIDPNATDKKIQDDFSEFLEKWRNHTNRQIANRDYLNTPLRWHERMVIPYFDLWFFAHLQKRTISRKKYVELLKLPELNDGESIANEDAHDALKNLMKSMREAISEESFHGLRNLCDPSPQTDKVPPPA